GALASGAGAVCRTISRPRAGVRRGGRGRGQQGYRWGAARGGGENRGASGHSAAGAVHGQWGDDCLGGGRAAGARAGRRVRGGGAAALAAGRIGGRSVSANIFVVGAGAWGTALAQ